MKKNKKKYAKSHVWSKVDGQITRELMTMLVLRAGDNLVRITINFELRGKMPKELIKGEKLKIVCKNTKTEMMKMMMLYIFTFEVINGRFQYIIIL